MKFPPGTMSFLIFFIFSSFGFTCIPSLQGQHPLDRGCYEVGRLSMCSSKAAFLLSCYPSDFCYFESSAAISQSSHFLLFHLFFIAEQTGCGRGSKMSHPSALKCHLCRAVPRAASVPTVTWTFSHLFSAVHSGLLPYSHTKIFLPLSLSSALPHLHLCLFP